MLRSELEKVKNFIDPAEMRKQRFYFSYSDGQFVRGRRPMVPCAVYLGGPIEGLSWEEAARWRINATEWLKGYGIETLDPMRRDFREVIESGADIDPNEIVIPDKWDILQSDAVLVNYSQRSTGTAMEIIYAYTYGIPVFVADTRPDGFINPWVTYHALMISNSIDESLKQIKDFIIPTYDFSESGV
jgi:nucleoside 2-deoxyribosyltransferase